MQLQRMFRVDVVHARWSSVIVQHRALAHRVGEAVGDADHRRHGRDVEDRASASLHRRDAELEAVVDALHVDGIDRGRRSPRWSARRCRRARRRRCSRACRAARAGADTSPNARDDLGLSRHVALHGRRVAVGGADRLDASRRHPDVEQADARAACGEQHARWLARCRTPRRSRWSSCP